MAETRDKKGGKRVAALLLAAGGSTRMGRPKQMLRFGGTSLLRRAASAALLSRCSGLFVVVGAESERVREELDGLPAVITENTEWRSGMAGSIGRGVEAVESWHEPFDGVLIMLADQPFVDHILLDRMVEIFENGVQIVASRYAGTVGVPALFSRDLYGKLQSLTGDRGAKALIVNGGFDTAYVDFPRGACDIDTYADYEANCFVASRDGK